MDYYDGNTVTALGNYAQNFATSDNSFATGFGPSVPGSVNLISGQTYGATTPDIAGKVDNGTVIGDPRPIAANDDCTIASAPKAALSGTNVGDLLNSQEVSWGWFQGGFAPSSVVNGKAVCNTARKNIAGATVPITSRTTSRSSITPAHRIRITCRQPQSLRLGRLIRLNISTPSAIFSAPCRPATFHQSLSSRPLPIRTLTPATPIRSTSRLFWWTRSTGSCSPHSGTARRSSSFMTAQTAGTTTSWDRFCSTPIQQTIN